MLRAHERIGVAALSLYLASGCVTTIDYTSTVPHKNAWGLGVAAGYDVTAIAFDANVAKLSHQGAGYRGLIHGPRWGLLFELLGDPAVAPAFKRRRDSESITLEVFGAAEWSSDHAVATPALWFALNGDVGNM